MPLCKAVHNVFLILFAGFRAKYAEIVLTFSENKWKDEEHREDAKRLFAYSPDTLRDTKLSIFRLLIVRCPGTSPSQGLSSARACRWGGGGC